MRQLCTFLVYLVTITLLVVGLADARRRGWRGSNSLFDEFGYARPSGSCPLGYVEQCVPDYLYGPYPSPAIVSASASAGGGYSPVSGISGGFGGGGIQGGSFRSLSARKPCPPCPPSHVCIPSSGRCVFIFPG